MTNQFQPPPRKLTALDEIKLRLNADPVNGAKRGGTLKVLPKKNNVTIQVYSNVEGDKDGGRVEAPMDSVVFMMLMQTLRRVINSPTPMKRVIPNKNFTFTQGQRSAEPKLISNTIVEKEADGSVFISVVNNTTTPIKFYFKPSDFHTLLDGEGKPVSRAEITQEYGLAWVDLMCRLVPIILADNFVEPPPREGGNTYGNNGGGNNYQRGNNGGGNNRPAQPAPAATAAAGWDNGGNFDDDLKF